MTDKTIQEKIETRGRTPTEIDWKKVDDLLMAGCMGTGIAAYIGISAQTLYDRCLTDKGILFAHYSQQKKEKGDEILRAHLYAKALGLTDKGDNTLLIWLGKNRLKQSDSPEQLAATEKAVDNMSQLMQAITSAQIQRRKDLNTSETSNSEEAKS